jgi:uncharacterized protein (DUF58 family)
MREKRRTRKNPTNAARLDGADTRPMRRWLSSLARRSPVNAGGVARVGRRHIYVLPTRSGLLLGGVLASMLLGSLNYQNNLALLFTFLMGSVAIVAMHHTWLNLLDLRISARGGPPVFAGQDALFTFSVEDDRSRQRPDLSILIGARRAAPVHLDGGDSRTVGIPVATLRRGSLDLDAVRVETRYPLGLFRAWCYPQTEARVTVYPRPADKGPVSYQVPTHERSNQGDLGVGADDFVGLRSYRAGDSPRRLDWKALARGRGLVVKQFGGDSAVRTWIDWDRLPATDTEMRLSLLCRQILDAAENGLSYGLHLPATTVPMSQGEIHKHRCLESLSKFDYG